MAIVMEANYSKKVGLPGYSSHQYMITLRTELADLSQVEAESTRLHALLQTSVDREIQKVGYLPANGNGNGSNHNNGHANGSNGNGHSRLADNGAWSCSIKQKDLIQKIVAENNLDKNKVEALAQERFSKGVRSLNKLEASALIEELLEQTGQSKNTGRGRFQAGFQQRAGAR